MKIKLTTVVVIIILAVALTAGVVLLLTNKDFGLMKTTKNDNGIEIAKSNEKINELEAKIKELETTESKDVLEIYQDFLKGLSNIKEADRVTISSNTNGKDATFILGKDKKVYLETYDESESPIPGAQGTGGEYNGTYIGIGNVVRIFGAMHGGHESGEHGLLILKDDGKLYLLRNPVDGNYTLEKIEREYIVDAYIPVSPYRRTYCIDIFGNSFIIE